MFQTKHITTDLPIDDSYGKMLINAKNYIRYTLVPITDCHYSKAVDLIYVFTHSTSDSNTYGGAAVFFISKQSLHRGNKFRRSGVGRGNAG